MLGDDLPRHKRQYAMLLDPELQLGNLTGCTLPDLVLPSVGSYCSSLVPRVNNAEGDGRRGR
jgi:hypothetical protein